MQPLVDILLEEFCEEALSPSICVYHICIHIIRTEENTKEDRISIWPHVELFLHVCVFLAVTTVQLP